MDNEELRDPEYATSGRFPEPEDIVNCNWCQKLERFDALEAIWMGHNYSHLCTTCVEPLTKEQRDG